MLSDFGDPADVTLLNVCSYPVGRAELGSVGLRLRANSGFLTIVKVADPDDSTNFVFNASANFAQWR